ncbi:MAG: DinB family protein [Terriglobales bacterium]
MNKDDIRLLYEYDRWANHRVLQAALALTPEQFTRDLGGSFRSVRDTLVHIVAGEWIWLEYWKDPPRTPELLADLRKRREALFQPDAFPTVAAVQVKWTEVEKTQAEFVGSVTDESLRKLIPFRGLELGLAHLMQHLANHSTYHRGQIALMMRQLGAEPLPTDFHVFLLEGNGKAQS